MAMLLLIFLEDVTEFLRKRSKLLNRFFNWLFARTQAKYCRLSEMGHVALLLYRHPTPAVAAGQVRSLLMFSVFSQKAASS